MRHLARAALLLGMVEVLLVLGLWALPGDVCATVAPDELDATSLAAFRVAWGCDAGALQALMRSAWMVLTLDFGVSPRLYQPVRTALLDATLATLSLSVPALLLGATIGVGAGWAQAFGSRAQDRVLAAIGAGLGALPSFAVAAGLMVLAMRLWPGWPLTGSCRGTVDCVQRAILPVLTLTIPVAASHARLARNGLRAERLADYVLAARARGLPEGRIRVAHMARNALPAWLAVLGLDLPWLFTGALVVEVTFGRPGLGALLARAAAAQDLAVLVGGTIIVTAAVLMGDLLTRALQHTLDPRAR